MGHKHAELMIEYAIDALDNNKPWELWEESSSPIGPVIYSDCQDPMGWHDTLIYRRKQKTITINGFEVPKPVSERLEPGQDYYVTKIDHRDVRGNTYEWNNTDLDFSRLNAGIIHLDEASAILHATALLSFTKYIGQ